MLTINFNPFPIIETERLLMRRITLADINEVFELRSSDEVMRYIDRPRMKNNEETIALIEKFDTLINANEGINWAITLKPDHPLIGIISFHRIEKENYRGEIGYLLHPAHFRKGIMQEAVEAMIKFGFETLKFHSIEAKVNPENVASIRLLEKNGFVREAYFRENFFYDGKFLDTGVYSLLAPKP